MVSKGQGQPCLWSRRGPELAFQVLLEGLVPEGEVAIARLEHGWRQSPTAAGQIARHNIGLLLACLLQHLPIDGSVPLGRNRQATRRSLACASPQNVEGVLGVLAATGALEHRAQLLDDVGRDLGPASLGQGHEDFSHPCRARPEQLPKPTAKI
eukprot:6920097-Heterocapsa_arctica.AAC.1